MCSIMKLPVTYIPEMFFPVDGMYDLLVYLKIFYWFKCIVLAQKRN